MTEEKHDKGGFKVTDKRQFTSDGSIREQDEEKRAPESARPEPTPIVGKDTEPSREAGPRASSEDKQSGPIDFGSFLLSLATTTLVHLGDVPDPSGAKPEPNIPAARQMIDILAMLQEKSEGNRTAEETKLLDDILYELRMRVLAKSQKISP